MGRRGGYEVLESIKSTCEELTLIKRKNTSFFRKEIGEKCE